jgi:hypothetical protein
MGDSRVGSLVYDRGSNLADAVGRVDREGQLYQALPALGDVGPPAGEAADNDRRQIAMHVPESMRGKRSDEVEGLSQTSEHLAELDIGPGIGDPDRKPLYLMLGDDAFFRGMPHVVEPLLSRRAPLHLPRGDVATL